MPAPATDAPLFTAEDLVDLVNEDISAEKAAIVESVVWGWLKRALTLEQRPAPVTDEIFGWAIELGAIFCENPNGLTAYQLGEERSQYSSERRDAILEDAASSGSGGNEPAGNSPRGSFPAPMAWPGNFWPS